MPMDSKPLSLKYCGIEVKLPPATLQYGEKLSSTRVRSGYRAVKKEARDAAHVGTWASAPIVVKRVIMHGAGKVETSLVQLRL